MLFRLVSVILPAIPAAAAPVALGPLADPSSFDRTTFSSSVVVGGKPGNINYNINLATQTYNVYLPANHTAQETCGLITYIDAGDNGTMPSAYQSVLDAHRIIFLAGTGIGNTVDVNRRRGVAIMGAFRMSELYDVDPARVFVMGNSGGARTGANLVYARPDWFSGFIGLSGGAIGGAIPGWEPPGRLDNASTTDDYWPSSPEYYEMADMIYYSQTAYRTLPPRVKFAIQAFNADFRRTELVGLYRYGLLNHGCAARLVYRNGGHSAANTSAFDESVRFLLHPHQTVIHDRFEDATLATHTDPGHASRAGEGFLDRSAAGAVAAETDYVYNNLTQRVLRLTPGAGSHAAVVEARDRFHWQNPHGIILDAALRAETQAGENQRIGLHVVRGDSDGTPDDNPGLHVIRNHGQKDQAILVRADGTVVELARWEYSGTHPMALPAGDKLFWDSAVAPEHAGRAKNFRGEDIRIVADAMGMQLTFSRPAAQLETSFPAGVILGATARTVTTSTSSYFNQSDNEEHPVVLQFLWSDMGLQPAIDALEFPHWKLMVSNRALVPALPAGDALVDEIILVAPEEIFPPSAPAIHVPSMEPATLPDSANALEIAAQWPSIGAAGEVALWSQVDGPGQVVFEDAAAAATRAGFSQPGVYRLRFSLTRNGVTESAERTILAGPPPEVALRQGENGYQHVATYIRNDGTNNANATWNSGSRNQVLVGYNNTGAMRCLFAHDLSSLPSGFPVTSARLDLWTSAEAGAGTLGEITLHALTAIPTEGTGDGLTLSNGAATGATWVRRTAAAGNGNWQLPGGDFSTAVLASVPGYAGNTTSQVVKSFVGNADFLAAVEAARQAGVPLGLLMRSANASGIHYTRFHSDDSADPARRPLLTIGFTANPVPSVDPGSVATAVVDEAVNLGGLVSGATSSVWSVVSGPGAVDFGDASVPATTARFAAAGSYRLRLTAANGIGGGSADRMITVAASDPLASWRQFHWGAEQDASIIGPAADPDRDGLENVIEFALGGNPRAADRPGGLTAGRDAGGAHFTYTRSESTPAAVDISVEWSETLESGDWQEPVAPEEILPVAAGPGLETVRVPLPEPATGRIFVRLRVSTR